MQYLPIYVLGNRCISIVIDIFMLYTFANSIFDGIVKKKNNSKKKL